MFLITKICLKREEEHSKNKMKRAQVIYLWKCLKKQNKINKVKKTMINNDDIPYQFIVIILNSISFGYYILKIIMICLLL